VSPRAPAGPPSAWDEFAATAVRLIVFVLLFLAFGAALNVAIAPVADTTSLGTGATIMAIAATVAGAIAIRMLDRRSPGALGIAITRSTPRELGVGLAIGVAAIGLAAAVLVATGALRYGPQPGDGVGWLGAAAATFALLAVPAFAEEVTFRGYPFQVLVQRLGAVPATLASSMLFAAAHAGNPNVGGIALVNIFLAGLLLSAAYLRTRSLWFATAVHLGWNWGMASPFDLPVSGLELTDTPLYEPVTTGAAWATGGAFGPEGGVIGTVAFAAALLAVLRWPGLRPDARLTALRPLPDSRE
jgi:membrane protease YdiL (CAAX protease family)